MPDPAPATDAVEPSPIELVVQRDDGPAGRVRIERRTDVDAPLADEALRDPERFVPAPTKPSQERKLANRRAVYSFFGAVDGREERLYMKLFRVRSLKDVLEELLLGKRARRSLRAGIEAERRGIAVPVHVGASSLDVPDRRPARSALVTVGVPHHHDARTLLEGELLPAVRHRRRFIAALGAFLGDVHRRGLVHTDLKLGNVFRLEPGPPVRFAVIDLDRARFQRAGARAGLRQAIDVRKLLRSSRRTLTPRERRLLLAAYLRGRDVDARRHRPRLLLLLADA